MPNTMTIQLQGFRELSETLKQFGPRVARNGLRSSTLAGAKVIREAIKAKAPVRTGALRESISVFRRQTEQTEARYSVGTRKVRGKFKDTALNRRRHRVGKTYYLQGPTFYARFVEFGTSRMAPHPFMRPGFADSHQAALEAIRNGLARAVDRAARRQG